MTLISAIPGGHMVSDIAFLTQLHCYDEEYASYKALAWYY
jgi:hypothetical protein